MRRGDSEHRLNKLQRRVRAVAISADMRRAWNAKAAAAATKKPVCKHRSLSTPPLPGGCAAQHCQGPMIQGQLPQENARRASGCCNVTPASAAADSPSIPYFSLPPAWVSQSLRISCSFYPVLSGWEQTPSGDLHAESGPNSKLNHKELYKQRKEREISPSSHRSSGLNLHNQFDVICICGIPEYAMNNPKIEVVDSGNKCRLRVCFLHLICF